MNFTPKSKKSPKLSKLSKSLDDDSSKDLSKFNNHIDYDSDTSSNDSNSGYNSLSSSMSIEENDINEPANFLNTYFDGAVCWNLWPLKENGTTSKKENNINPNTVGYDKIISENSCNWNYKWDDIDEKKRE